MTHKNDRDRAAVQLTDIVLTFALLVALMVLAPVIYEFVGMVSSTADPLSGMLLQLAIPLLFIALIVSVGVSARRRV